MIFESVETPLNPVRRSERSPALPGWVMAGGGLNRSLTCWVSGVSGKPASLSFCAADASGVQRPRCSARDIALAKHSWGGPQAARWCIGEVCETHDDTRVLSSISLYIAGSAASRLAALLLGHTCPMCFLVAPGQPSPRPARDVLSLSKGGRITARGCTGMSNSGHWTGQERRPRGTRPRFVPKFPRLAPPNRSAGPSCRLDPAVVWCRRGGVRVDRGRGACPGPTLRAGPRLSSRGEVFSDESPVPARRRRADSA